MRPLIFGSPEDPRMQSIKTELEAKGLRPVFRAPQHFKASEIEPASIVFVGEEQDKAQAIAQAYEEKVTLLPAPEPAPSKLLASLEITVADLPEFKEAVEAASKRIAELEATVSAKDARITELEVLLAERDARIADLEALLADDDGTDASSEEIESLKTKIADLEAKKEAGTMSRTDPALLGRYIKKLAGLTAEKA